MRVTNIEAVRRTCGLTSDIIEDDDVSRTIDEAIAECAKYLNTAIIPKEVIEYRDSDLGTNSNIMFLRRAPVLTIKALKIDGTAISPKYIHQYKNSGKMVLSTSAEETAFDDSDPQTNIVKYLYGRLEETETETTNSNDETEAASVEIDVTSTSGFEVGQYIRIQGMDRYDEVTKITAITTGTSITCELILPHEAGSRIVIMKIPTIVKRLVNIIASLMLVAREVGASFDDIVGYGLGDLNIQKGEPYTQWRETHLELEKERKEILQRLRPMPVVA